MTVAVAKNMNNMGNHLRRRGFNVVTYGEYPYPIDALVYESVQGELNMQSIKNEHISGILIVNSTGKTPDEVAQILMSRLYTPLF